MISLMASVLLVLTPVGTRVDHPSRPGSEPQASHQPTIVRQVDCANRMIPESLPHIQVGAFIPEALQRPNVGSSWRSWRPVGPLALHSPSHLPLS